MTDYELCGWRVASEMPLPELARWTGDDRAPDVTIAIGAVPALLDEPTVSTSILQMDASGRGRFHIHGVGTWLIEQGRRITIDPLLPLDAPDIRLFLFGTPFGMLCHQRGLVPIHAASIEVDGKALLLAGPSGVGKSTLAAGFLRRGFRMMGDDIAPFDPATGMILPGLRRLRLWHDSVRGTGGDVAGLERCRADLEKYSRPLDDAHVDHPLAASAIVHLLASAPSAGGATFSRVRGVGAVDWMARQIYRSRTMNGVHSAAIVYGRASQAAAAIPLHLTFTYPPRYPDLDAMVEMIVDTVRAGQ